MLREGLVRGIERMLKGPRRRLERLRQSPEAEVDRRLAELLDAAPMRERGAERERGPGRRWRERE